MGVDIQTYRARIGSYRQYRCSGAIDSCRSFRGIDVAIKVSNNLKTVGCVLFIGVLLMIAGVEPNPGPREKDTAGYQCDDVVDVVKGTKRSVDGRDTLTEEPTKIKLSGVSVDMNRAMLKRFFENAIDFCGKVVEVTVNPKESSAIITFDTSAAVYEIMNKRPMTILGFKIDVDVYRDKIYSESEHAERDVQGPESLQTTGETITSKPVSIGKETKGAETSGQINDKRSDTLTEEPTKIKLSRVSVDMNRAMLKRFFENAIDFDGKVVEVTVNSKESSAIVTFDTSAAVNKIMSKRPLTLLGLQIDVDVYSTNSVARAEKEPDGTNYAARAETEPGGEAIASKPNSIGRQTKKVNSSSQINDERETIASKPDSIGRQTKKVKSTSQINDEQDTNDSEPEHVERGVQGPDSLQITGETIASKPDSIGRQTMRTETSSQIIYERGNIASKPDSIGRQAKGEETSSQINVELSDTSLVVEPQDIPRIRITGLAENANNEMLAMYFVLEDKNGGGKVKNIEIDQKEKFATIYFEEKAGTFLKML